MELNRFSYCYKVQTEVKPTEIMMSSPYSDGVFDKSTGGQFLMRRYQTGSQLSRDGVSMGRRFIVSFHLEAATTHHLSVSLFSFNRFVYD